jgi:hypothetical protein
MKPTYFNLPAAKAIAFGFDRVAVAIDSAGLSSPASRSLRIACGERLTQIIGRLPFNPSWKAKVELFQPSHGELKLLVEDCLGSEINALVVYGEIAMDFIFSTQEEAAQYGSWLATHITPRYQRDAVQLVGDTVYFGRRTDEAGEKRGRVVCIYFDRPSKLAGNSLGRPCVHIEVRLTGSGALAAVGIGSVDDLLVFDHAAFWSSAVLARSLPSKTKLGRLLGGPGGSTVSGAALRKRAEKFIGACSVAGQFFMHNAARLNGRLTSRFQKVAFLNGATINRARPD